MGVRPHLFVISRARLVDVLALPVQALAETIGARVVEDPAGLFESRDYVVAAKDRDFLVDVVDPAASVGQHLARTPYDVRGLLECLAASKAGPHVAHVRCHRRWWVGSIAAALRDEHRLDARAIRTLGGLTGSFDVGDADVDAAGRVWASADRVLAPSSEPGLWIGDMPVVDLASVLERLSHRRDFGPPRQRYGIAPARDDLAGWTEWVSGLVEEILRVAQDQPDGWLVSYVS